MGKQIPVDSFACLCLIFPCECILSMWLAEDYPAFYSLKIPTHYKLFKKEAFILWILSANLHLFLSLSLSNSRTKGSKEHVGEQ